MDKKVFEKITKVAEDLDWNLQEESNDILFSICSPEGQDFNIDLYSGDINNIEDLVNKIDNYCENFDVSYETYLWLDNTGHGKNGSPYDMKDLYEDMEWCLEATKELKEHLEKLIK